MKAVYVKEFGDADNLEIREIENPLPPAGSRIMVQVKASAVNRADILQRKGLYPAPDGFPKRVLGLEFAGEIVETGAEVRGLKIGDRVFGITAGGANAELLVTEESLLASIPDNLSFTEAAAVPEAFITAHDALFSQGKLQNGESLLIHAVGSGVGLAALQLAKVRGADVFGTSRTPEKLGACERFGLDKAILTKESPDFARIVKERTGSSGVNVILDLVGANYFEANLESLAIQGRLILVGLVGGNTASFNLGTALRKRLQIIGTVLRSRSTVEKTEATRRFAEEVVPLLASGEIVPNIDKTYNIQDIKLAHKYVESNESFGKVVLEF